MDIKTKKAQEQDWDGILATKLNLKNFHIIKPYISISLLCVLLLL